MTFNRKKKISKNKSSSLSSFGLHNYDHHHHHPRCLIHFGDNYYRWRSPYILLFWNMVSTIETLPQFLTCLLFRLSGKVFWNTKQIVKDTKKNLIFIFLLVLFCLAVLFFILEEISNFIRLHYYKNLLPSFQSIFFY